MAPTQNPIVQGIKDRAEAGKDLMKASVAQGEPGTPQPKQNTDVRASAQETLEHAQKLIESSVAKTRGPAATASDYHPIPAAERTGPSTAPAATAQLDQALGAIGTARTAMTTQLTSDARIASDPRYERDQKVFALGQQGKLGAVPPSDAEKVAMASRAGIDPEAAKLTPSTPAEQVEQDMPRLEAAEKSTPLSPVISAGEQEGEPKNNFTKAKEEGKNTGDRAPKDQEARTFDTGSGNESVIK